MDHILLVLLQSMNIFNVQAAIVLKKIFTHEFFGEGLNYCANLSNIT